MVGIFGPGVLRKLEKNESLRVVYEWSYRKQKWVWFVWDCKLHWWVLIKESVAMG